MFQNRISLCGSIFTKTRFNLDDIFQQFFTGLRQTSIIEFIAVITGIVSVWFSRKENILVYPTGLINTIIYIYLSIKGHLLGEASVNIYYTIMSIYGWILWSKKDESNHTVVIIKNSSVKEWAMHLLFFLIFYIGIYLALSYLKKEFAPGAIPAADAFASATAYTGMWLMAKKKVESWYWLQKQVKYLGGQDCNKQPFFKIVSLLLFLLLQILNYSKPDIRFRISRRSFCRIYFKNQRVTIV
jgi:nicotinamide mononucleotide transporter